VQEGKIRFGLLGVKNVGEGAIEAIVKARETKGLPKDIFQFVSNLDTREVNKKALESLIEAGALDSIDENRAAHMAVYEGLLESAQNSSRKNLEGQMSLFQLNAEEMEAGEISGKLPKVANFPKEQLIAMEKEMLGVYLSEHPLKDYQEQIGRLVTVTAEDLAHVAAATESGEAPAADTKVFDGMRATMAGIITHKRTLFDKSNKMMAFVTMEDLYGEVELVVFSKTYEKCASLIEDDSLIIVKGTVNFKEGEMPKILAGEILSLRETSQAAKGAGAGAGAGGAGAEALVKLKIPAELADGLEKIKEILRRYKGETPVVLYPAAGKPMKAPPDLWVSGSEDFQKEMSALIGAENLKI